MFACLWEHGWRLRCTHTMRSFTCLSVVVYVARKLRPCPSYSRRRDRINLVLWRSLDKRGGGGVGPESRIADSTMANLSCTSREYGQLPDCRRNMSWGWCVAMGIFPRKLWKQRLALSRQGCCLGVTCPRMRSVVWHGQLLKQEILNTQQCTNNPTLSSQQTHRRSSISEIS